MNQNATINMTQEEKVGLVDLLEDRMERESNKSVRVFRRESDNTLIKAGGNEIVITQSGPEEYVIDWASTNQNIAAEIDSVVLGESDQEPTPPPDPTGKTVSIIEINDRYYPALPDIARNMKQAGAANIVRETVPKDEAEETMTELAGTEPSFETMNRFTSNLFKDEMKIMEVNKDDYDTFEFTNLRSGAIQYKPPFSKKEANYHHPASDDFDPSHKRCEECAHYIEGGGCHVVESQIQSRGYCENLFADMGVYAGSHNGELTLNLILWGEQYDWALDEKEEFLEKVAEAMSDA